MSGYAGLTDAQLLQQLALSQAPNASAAQPPVVPVQQSPLPDISGSRTSGADNLDPSQLTDAQLHALDIAGSAGAGLENAASGIATYPRSFADAGQSAAQHIVDFMGRQMGTGHMTVPPISDLLGVQGQAGKYGEALIGAGAKLLHVNPTLAQMVAGFANPTMGISGPTTGQGARALNGGVPVYEPQTTAGRYAERIAEMAPIALQPGSALTRTLGVLAPGVGSQLAEDAVPEQYKGAAALAGALAGGALHGGARTALRAPQAAMGAALGDVTDEQLAQAQALRQQAAGRGLQLTVPEAVQQVTNNATGLGRLQRVIEGTRQGQAVTAPYFAQRPSQVNAAVRSLADAIAPPTEQPGMLAQRAQTSATSALDRARQVVNATAGPDYAALPSQSMEPEAYSELSANPSYQVALQQLRGHPELGAAYANLPDNNLAVINEVKKRLAVGATQAAGTPLAPGDNYLAGLRIGAKAATDEAARAASPQYAAANDTVRDLSQQYVDPLKAGPLGTISNTDKLGAQTGALYPAQPPEGAANETGQAMRVLNVADPGLAGALTRQHLVDTLNNSMKGLQGGQNQYAGAKYAVALAGHPEQLPTLTAGISVLPDGTTRAQELADLLEGLRATGKRQPPGSMTAFNESDLRDLHISPAISAMRSFNIAEPLEPIARAVEGVNYRRNVKSLADMILAPPDKTEEILKAAKAAKPGSSSALLPALIQANGSRR